MAVIVSVLGSIGALIGLLGLANPRYIVDLVQFWRGPTRFRLAVGVRVVLGIVLLVVAPACRVPILVQCVGAISVVAAIVILVVGQKRLDAFIRWWLTRPSAVVRVSALFAFSLGVLLVYAGA